MVAQTAAFKKAVEDSRKLKAQPTQDELLEVPFSLLLCFSALQRAHADTLVTFSFTQTSSKAPAKISPRPNSPAASPSRFVHLISSLSQPTTYHIRDNLAESSCIAQEKYKYNAWKKVAVENKVTPSAAQQHYVQLVEKLKGTYGYAA